MALILNPLTGNVSPQYHVKFDDLFETTSYPHNWDQDLSDWQVKAGFKRKQRGRTISSQEEEKGAQETREPWVEETTTDTHQETKEPTGQTQGPTEDTELPML